MINTDHHLKAAIKRLTALIESEKENDVELSPTIVNIDEQSLINFCKEKGCLNPVYFTVGNIKNLRSLIFIGESSYINLVGIPVPNTNQDEDHVN